MELPQIRRFYGKMKHIPLWPIYISEKGRTLGKKYGIKVRCYWETPLRNTLVTSKTYWELEGNMLGTK
jgi:hypothetical protein